MPNLRGADATLVGENLATYHSFAAPFVERERKMLAWRNASFRRPLAK